MGKGKNLQGRVKFIGGYLNRKRVPVFKMQLVSYKAFMVLYATDLTSLQDDLKAIG